MDTFTSAPVILSSSFAKSTPHGFGSTPSRQINSQPYSSPDLPSPSELLGAPREKSTSSEMPAHWDATANGFTKASNLLHSLPVVEVLKETNQLAYDQEKLATELEGELRLADSVQVRQDDGVRVGQNKPRKRRKSASAPSPAVPRHSDTKEFKITKQKNPAKKKALQEAAQSKIKGKVKKPRVSLKGEDTSETTKQCEGDTVPPIERQMEIDTVIDLEKGNLALGLGKVSARRREWTPVRDSEATGHTGDASNDGTNHIEPASSAKLAAQLSSFECDTTALPRATSASVRGIATKRRKIDVSNQLATVTLRSSSRNSLLMADSLRGKESPNLVSNLRSLKRSNKPSLRKQLSHISSQTQRRLCSTSSKHLQISTVKEATVQPRASLLKSWRRARRRKASPSK